MIILELIIEDTARALQEMSDSQFPKNVPYLSISHFMRHETTCAFDRLVFIIIINGTVDAAMAVASDVRFTR